MARPFATFAFAALLASPAFAADMPVKAPVAPRVVAPSWVGCYVGANVGGLRTDARANTSPTGPDFVPSGPEALAANSHSYDLDSSSVAGGVQAGCNWQTGNWIYGLEADFNWTGADRSATVAYPDIVTPAVIWVAHSETLTHKLSWFSTARVRWPSGASSRASPTL